ncbi:hypothetical protein C8F04DRAFT_1195391 [Mycena alexandri]|uniref:Uncharacterized protein n=1 Tax=Mycena alexandri TaxID=1745969 RepID=A0AAD6WQK9_9AGAR|nr:hypothetical protein C8F04DRAFT_1195391 [Mycena alexandri]
MTEKTCGSVDLRMWNHETFAKSPPLLSAGGAALVGYGSSLVGWGRGIGLRGALGFTGWDLRVGMCTARMEYGGLMRWSIATVLRVWRRTVTAFRFEVLSPVKWSASDRLTESGEGLRLEVVYQALGVL